MNQQHVLNQQNVQCVLQLHQELEPQVLLDIRVQQDPLEVVLQIQYLLHLQYQPVKVIHLQYQLQVVFQNLNLSHQQYQDHPVILQQYLILHQHLEQDQEQKLYSQIMIHIQYLVDIQMVLLIIQKNLIFVVIFVHLKIMD